MIKNISNTIGMIFLGIALTNCSGVKFQDLGELESVDAENLVGTEEGFPALGDFKTEVFTQSDEARMADILFIDDNSGSMIEEQRELGGKISNFLAQLTEIDWHLGITTTDVSNGTYGIKGSLLGYPGISEKFLTPNVPNYNDKFLSTIVREETSNCGARSCPSGTEQPLYASMLAMSKRNAENQGFFRNNADLVIVVLSDEDEMSTGPSDATTGEDVIEHARRIWGNEKRVTAYGIIIRPGDTGCKSQQTNSGGEYGDFVAHFASITGGGIGSICDKDYSPLLSDIGDEVRTLLHSVTLASFPDPDSVKVHFAPPQPQVEWTVEDNRVLFDPPPPVGTKIRVDYNDLEEKE